MPSHMSLTFSHPRRRENQEQADLSRDICLLDSSGEGDGEFITSAALKCA